MDALHTAIADAMRYLAAWEIKTFVYFLRVLSRDVRALYADKISEREFVDNLAALLEQQLRRAWNEGMRNNGLDPQRDMTADFEAAYQEIVVSEFAYVDQFAADIVAARDAQSGTDALLARAGLWANRYNDTVNQSMLITAPGQGTENEARYKWVYGDTEHCETCAALNGIVATASDWAASGYKPQSPPNDLLECGGWRCQCQLELTDDEPTAGGIPSV